MMNSSSPHSGNASDEPIVFVVDDEAGIRVAVANLLASAGIRVMAFSSGRDFLDAERPDAPACLVLDLALPDLSGLEVQEELAAKAGPPIVFISGQGDVPASVRAMK